MAEGDRKASLFTKKQMLIRDSTPQIEWGFRGFDAQIEEGNNQLFQWFLSVLREERINKDRKVFKQLVVEEQ